MSESPKGDSRPFDSIHLRLFSKRGSDRGWKIRRTVVKARLTIRRKNLVEMDGLLTRRLRVKFERLENVGVALAVRWRRRCCSPTFRSLGGEPFFDESYANAGKAPMSVQAPPPRHYPPGRRKLDQTTLAGAQRSCRWLFHFHRAVFWPDRTRSCPQPQRNALFSPRRKFPRTKISINQNHPNRSIPRPSRAFSRSFAGREEVEPRGVQGVTSNISIYSWSAPRCEDRVFMRD